MFVEMASSLGEVTELGVTVSPHSIPEDAHQVLSLIRNNWRREDVRFKPIGETGHINSMTVCYVTADMADAVVLRVFEAAYEFVMDRKREIQCTRLLHHLRISPRLLCTFNNGVCFEYVNAGRFQFKDLSPFRNVKLARAVGRELARVHCRNTYELATSKSYDIRMDPVPFESLRKLLVNWPTSVANPAANELFQKGYPPLDELSSEVESVICVIEKMDQPLVFTHNDANPSNVLYDRLKDKATLVDYELCGFGPATYDLAVFLEFSATGLHPDIDNNRHTEAYQKSFLREYLETKRGLDHAGCDVTDDDVNRLYAMTSKTMLLFYLMFGLAMVYQAARPASHGVDPTMFMR
ncbi:ethanolamine kinase 1-like isoform X2 [Lineus longissimus]